jgi:hypothetical protein
VVFFSISSCFGPRWGRRGVSERLRSRRWRLHETAPPLCRRRDHTRVIRTPSTRRASVGRGRGWSHFRHTGGGIARIKVGAATETELKDKKLRYEDALNAVKSALKTGILPGGGSTLAYLLRFEDEICNAIEDEDEKRGAKIVFNSLSAPVCQIAKNCGMISASRRVEAPSLHSDASSPGDEVAGGFFFYFEAVRTDAPRRHRGPDRFVESHRQGLWVRLQRGELRVR